MTARQLNSVLERQAKTLLDSGFHALCGVTQADFLTSVEGLASSLDSAGEIPTSGNIPLCVAFRPGLVSLADAMARIEAKSATGVVEMTPLSPDAFHVIDRIHLPRGEFYLLLDIDTGRDLLNVSPEESLAIIERRSRTPLTMEEGVALTMQHPELLTDKKNYNCIQMAGSRKAGDQRIPSIWFSKGRPRLGWCWDRNVHTWLGSASAALRLGGAKVSVGLAA
ncbi:DUF5701 family protein [Bosea vestrisii]|uniref:DUF5701 family protein n=1 Tax=Bosea vestrisii TaxID=151416 RepID=UPI0024DF9A5A|nr:DUF5701 family protein [Bosea vestrisii]WID97325.1 DUF5701 family protein [Bosea vestrisii]